MPVVSPVELQSVEDVVCLIISGAADAKRRAAEKLVGERKASENFVKVHNITKESHCPEVALDIFTIAAIAVASIIILWHR